MVLKVELSQKFIFDLRNPPNFQDLFINIKSLSPFL